MKQNKNDQNTNNNHLYKHGESKNRIRRTSRNKSLEGGRERREGKETMKINMNKRKKEKSEQSVDGSYDSYYE